MNEDREVLVAQLRELGITYLAPSDAVSEAAGIAPEVLLAALAQHSDARLRLALVPLLIRHPALAGSVRHVCWQLDAGACLELQTLYTAAVYLQRLWKTRLGLYLEGMAVLPDLYSEELGLPPAEEYFGKTGLHDLAAAWRARSRYPFDRLAALNQTMDLFFEQLKLEKARQPHAPAG